MLLSTRCFLKPCRGAEARSPAGTVAAAAAAPSLFGGRPPCAARLRQRRARSAPAGQVVPPAAAVSRRHLGALAALVPLAASAQAQAEAGGAAAAAALEAAAPRLEVDGRGVERLALQPQGWNTWSWRGHSINYLSAGSQGPIVLLIHGFGASVYHFRYNVPELAKHCRVYAMDCLGFGWSEKPLVDYRGYNLWPEQIADFVREVIGTQEKVVVVGNSLGGYNSLAAAAQHPQLFRAVVLMNSAGRFEDPAEIAAAEVAAASSAPAAAGGEAAGSAGGGQGLWEAVKGGFQRLVVGASFYYTKNPLRIKQVLRQVYHSTDSIDEDLVQSIALPAEDPNAPDVFYRIITGRGEPMNRLLARLDGMPLLLLWGSKDPWCVPARADQIQRFYPAAERIDIDEAGHCPHDDAPAIVNASLLAWVRKLEAAGR